MDKPYVLTKNSNPIPNVEWKIFISEGLSRILGIKKYQIYLSSLKNKKFIHLSIQEVPFYLGIGTPLSIEKPASRTQAQHKSPRFIFWISPRKINVT